MYDTVTAICGCVIEVDVCTYEDGCCDYCRTTVAEVESAVITESCEVHSAK